MKCLKCQMKYSKESTHCKICGSKLVSEEEENIQEPIEVLVIPEENPKDVKMDPITNYRKEKQEQELLAMFIGNNADILMNKAWNWSAFFFGLLYMAYRKSWKFAIISWTISILMQCILLFIEASLMTYSAAYLLLLLFFGFSFNHVYCQGAKKKIAKLQKKYSQLPEQEFFKVIYKKGGTSIINIVLWIIVYGLILYPFLNFFVWPFLRSEKYCDPAICNEDRSVCVYVINGELNLVSCKNK